MKINGKTYYLWRAVDHEGEVLESFVTERRVRRAALAFLKKAMKRYGPPKVIVTGRLRSYRAAMVQLGNARRQEIGRWLNNRGEILTCLFDEESIQCNAFAERRTFRNLSPYIAQFAITLTTKDISFHETTLWEDVKLHLSSGSKFLLRKPPHLIGKLRRVCVRLTAPLEAQYEQALSNINAIVASEGGTSIDIAKITIFLT